MADINLTTTAVAATATLLSTLRTRLRRELHDEDAASYRWTDAVLDRHLTRAVHEVSLVLPREMKTALSTTTGARDLSLTTLTDLVRIDAVEYPTAQWPPSFVAFSVFRSTLTLLVEGAPAGIEAVNVYWGCLHTVDGSISTLPAVAEDVVVTGASAYAALEWASFATNRANVDGTAAFDNYRAWGEDRLRLFRDQLREFGERARLRAASLFAPQRPGSRSTVQW